MKANELSNENADECRKEMKILMQALHGENTDEYGMKDFLENPKGSMV